MTFTRAKAAGWKDFTDRVLDTVAVSVVVPATPEMVLYPVETMSRGRL